jgi:hypothetical protein
MFCDSGAPIHWKTKLQKTIILLTAEVEYYAASTVIYLRSLVRSQGHSSGIH